MMETLMRTHLADKIKSVAVKRGDEFPCRKRVEATIIDGHVLDGNRNAGCLLRNLSDFNRVCRAFWQRLPFLNKLLNDHADNFVDVVEGFLFRAP